MTAIVPTNPVDPVLSQSLHPVKMQSTCRKCGGKIEYELPACTPMILGNWIAPTICNACHTINEEAAKQSAQSSRLLHWSAICPPLYRDSDPNHPGMPTLAKRDRIIGWQYGPKGLMIHGETRRGKTRCVWLLLKRLALEGRSILAMTSGEFARQCAEAHVSGAESARAWFDRLVRCDVLFLDDLGKFKLTERVESDLFDLAEHRFSLLRPIIFTTNMVGDTLKDAMTADRSAPLIARIREFCEAISLHETK